MYQNFEGLEPGEDIKNFKFFWVSPNPLGVLNQKNLFSTLIYHFEHFGTDSNSTDNWIPEFQFEVKSCQPSMITI